MTRGLRHGEVGIRCAPALAGGRSGWVFAALVWGLFFSAMAAAIIAASALFPLREWLTEGPTLCPVRLFTGLLCPGCGSTRAVVAMFHGDVLHALGANPLATVAIPFLAVAATKQAVRSFDDVAIGRTYIPARYIWALFGLLVAYTTLRNLPWAPFTLLAP